MTAWYTQSSNIIIKCAEDTSILALYLLRRLKVFVCQKPHNLTFTGAPLRPHDCNTILSLWLLYCRQLYDSCSAANSQALQRMVKTAEHTSSAATSPPCKASPTHNDWGKHGKWQKTTAIQAVDWSHCCRPVDVPAHAITDYQAHKQIFSGQLLQVSRAATLLQMLWSLVHSMPIT